MNFKIISSTLIAICVAANVWAGDFISGGIVYSFTDKEGEVAVDQNIIDGVNAYSGVYIIPEMVNFEGDNYNVTSIADNAFAQSKITDICLPNSITNIGESAFAYADNLTNITLPLNIEVIPKACFAGTSIVNIALPEGVKTIGYGAFQSCTLLHTVLLPSTLTLIEAYAFNNCHNLYEIYCAANTPPKASGWAIFIGLSGIDVIVPDYEAIDAYADDNVWGDESTFTLYPNEDISLQMSLNGEDFQQNWKRISLGNNFAYKVIDEDDELMALTAADYYYLPARDHDVTYTIIPTTMMSDSDPISIVVEKTTGIERLIEDAFPAEPEPIIVAHQGTLYVYGDNYRRWIYVWDMNGRLYYQRISSDAQIIDLPPHRVYIVRVGNYVKKVFL